MKNQTYLKNVVTLKYFEKLCMGCGLCATVCPHGVFEMRGDKAILVNRDSCMECGACAQNCPVDAIKVETGVGCTAGIMIGAIRGIEPTCDCGNDMETPCC